MYEPIALHDKVPAISTAIFAFPFRLNALTLPSYFAYVMMKTVMNGYALMAPCLVCESAGAIS